MKVLYVGRSKQDPTEFCPGSLVCIALLEKLDEQIEVQDCSILRQSQELPDWLNGTPIFIDRNNPEPKRGSDAVRALQHLVASQGSASKATQRNAQVSQQSSGNTRMQPELTRMPGNPRENITRHEPAESNTDVLPFGGFDDDDKMDATSNGAQPNAPISNEKITEQDLQAYMQMRNSSPASASSQASQQPT